MRKVTSNGNNTWQEEGKGSAVVLIHGFSENSGLWHLQTNRLKDHYKVIVPDLPGTAAAPLTTPLSIESMADYVYTILLEQNIKEAVVIGHSMGGYVALALAEKHPELIKGLGLFHSTAKADTEEKKENRTKSINLMNQYGAETFLRQTLPNMFSPVTKSKHPELIEACVKMGQECSLPALVAYYEAMKERPDRTAVLQQLTVPVLFVVGKDDNAVPPDSILPQITLPRVSNVHIFEAVGHMGMWEAPAESNLILEQFIAFCQL
ncbi:pimeloyl-ACP methyl ester carboxylesterase [Chitinophaga terrae (ex Kim and Jung 2007)]|uniref:alpha/beta fold hydrolase n=1 Tax=Chitinophaga terrae (ex Kim and Jung 2007) TaxID=408074 RepID=UPI002788AA63|nr:alpha/beta hydrolase [Chitinophaga terrae (ex Kim and Jung 2007)]MDQ0107764.1 pimeloyl-ACP methyl ester carboxylesterase [Chitinophaga terrae (ex Kim and Jung 2007)]